MGFPALVLPSAGTVSRWQGGLWAGHTTTSLSPSALTYLWEMVPSLSWKEQFSQNSVPFWLPSPMDFLPPDHIFLPLDHIFLNLSASDSLWPDLLSFPFLLPHQSSWRFSSDPLFSIHWYWMLETWPILTACTSPRYRGLPHLNLHIDHQLPSGYGHF